MTITIPAEGRGGNPVVAYVNGVKYTIPRGIAVAVPDAVAEAVANLGIELIHTNGYVEDERILPVVSASDNDKVLTVVGGKWAAKNLPADVPELPDASELADGTTLAVDDHAWIAVAPEAAAAETT